MKWQNAKMSKLEYTLQMLPPMLAPIQGKNAKHIQLHLTTPMSLGS